jgi:hypothetical protein
MATGYARQSAAAIVSGLTITAAAFNNEFNTLQSAFDTTNGHNHDGSTSGCGPKINLTTSVTGVLPAANGGISNAFFAIAGPATSTKTYTFPNATCNVLTDNAAVTVAQGGTGQTTYTNGQLLIGNTSGNTLTKATLTAGSGISISNSTGSITITATGQQASSAALDSLVTVGSSGSNGYVKRTGVNTFSSGTAISLTADISGILPVANGGTGTAFFTVSGPSTTRTYTFPDSNASVVTGATLTNHGVLLGQGTSAITATAAGTSGQLLVSGGAGADPSWQTVVRILQIVGNTDGALQSFVGATTTPVDDTIPQNTEGNQVMSQTITPSSTTNVLRIRATVNFSHSAASSASVAALHQNGVSNALSVAHCFIATAGGTAQLVIDHTMLAGTTSTITFTIRVGSDKAGDITFNGAAGTRRYGGVSGSAITIIEHP